MQRLHFFTLAICLLVVFPKLSAATPQGRFNLQEGDWFEMRVEIPINFSPKLTSFTDLLGKSNSGTMFFVSRYQLTKQHPNGNQVYNVTIKRIQSKMQFAQSGILGYDSYYPVYTDNIKNKPEIIQFETEISRDGNVIRFDSIKGDIPEIKLNDINPRKNTTIKYDITLNFPKEFVETAFSFISIIPAKSGSKKVKILNSEQEIEFKTGRYTETPSFETYQILVDDTSSFEIKFVKDIGVPVSNEISTLVDASFPIPGNTVISGKLADQGKREIRISLDDDWDEKYFKKKYFRTQEDGSFSCPVFLHEPLYLNIQIGDRKFTSFMEPNDTLEILDYIDKKIRVNVDGSFNKYENVPGYMIHSSAFSGSAAYNARLSFEMEEWITYFAVPKDITSYQDYEKTLAKNISHLQKKYHGNASKKCLDYFWSKWNYYNTSGKVFYWDTKKNPILTSKQLAKKYNMSIIFDYPSGFFDGVDTLPTLMYPYEWSMRYRDFLDYAYDYKKYRLGKSMGGLNNDFYGNYFFARAALKGLPLYTALYKILDKELRQGSESTEKIESFYKDFMNNCNDPKLTKPLAQIHETVANLSIGKTFPVQTFLLSDSTEFNLSKYKGKPTCIILMHAEKNKITEYKSEMDKFKSDEVEFIFIALPNRYTSPADSAILAMPNVTVIDVADQNLNDKLAKSNTDKIYILDKWQRIVENNLESPLNHFGSKELEEAIKKAISTKRFSKEQRSSALTIGGWSLGSILFTFFIGLGIYRRRLRMSQKQEAIKRQIKELEVKAIRSQMNPHFIFNALNSIQSLVNSGQYKEANIYLSKFSVLLRGVLHNSEKNMIPLSEELDSVKLYCELEQLRFEFKFHLETDPEINANLTEIPGMIIQPLAENAIVHGISSIGSKGVLDISIHRCDGCLSVLVKDNGPGLPPSNDTLSQKGFGLKLVNERLSMLNHQGKKAELSVKNNRQGPGTIAMLVIPVED